MNEIAENCRRIRDRIQDAAARSRRDPQAIRLLAVTKRVPPDHIRIAVATGIRELGENRLQEAMGKFSLLQDLDLTWHFIGHLQTNKAKKVVELFDCIQSVDRFELASRINDVTAARLPVFVEVELGNEVSKSGIRETELDQLLDQLRLLDKLEVRGLMAIPPYSEDPEGSRPYFARLRTLAERAQLPELSMGMSHDFEIAIEEGATIVRIGTALFGQRA